MMPEGLVALQPGETPDPMAIRVVHHTKDGGMVFEVWEGPDGKSIPYKDWEVKGARGMRAEYDAMGHLVSSRHLGPKPIKDVVEIAE